MVKIKPFRALRPPKKWVEKVASRPYDVLDSAEARAEAADNEKSLYHITKPEIDFPEGICEYDTRVYERASQNFLYFQQQGWLVQDETDHYYIYAQTMNEKTQYGLVVCVWIKDYVEGRLKKHEQTRKDKEEDRVKHIRVTQANIEPVFLAYPDKKEIDTLVKRYTQDRPIYDFTVSDDGFRHQLWIIDKPQDIIFLTERFAEIPYMYIADGHHRSAAAALVGEEKAQQSRGKITGNEEFNFFMAVCFPSSQLTVLDYNRVVRDLNRHSEQEFLTLLKKDFDIEFVTNAREARPKEKHQFALYLGKTWYRLKLHSELAKNQDPIQCLDVNISSQLILYKLLGIKDLRTDKRVDFVGGLRGYEELERRVNSGEMRLALALHPVNMNEIMDIADQGSIMPPKATWFEPKLRSGLVIHKF